MYIFTKEDIWDNFLFLATDFEVKRQIKKALN